jgi:hypothetical protein
MKELAGRCLVAFGLICLAVGMVYLSLALRDHADNSRYEYMKSGLVLDRRTGEVFYRKPNYYKTDFMFKYGREEELSSNPE